MQWFVNGIHIESDQAKTAWFLLEYLMNCFSFLKYKVNEIEMHLIKALNNYF